MIYPNSQKGPFRGSVHYGWGEHQQTVSVYLLFLPPFVQRMGIWKIVKSWKIGKVNSSWVCSHYRNFWISESNADRTFG